MRPLCSASSSAPIQIYEKTIDCMEWVAMSQTGRRGNLEKGKFTFDFFRWLRGGIKDRALPGNVKEGFNCHIC